MEELRTILLDLQLKLNSIVNRIPEGSPTGSPSLSLGRALSMSKSPVEARSTETELPGEGPNGCPEQYHTAVLVSFHKWARIILSLYIDKVGKIGFLTLPVPPCLLGVSRHSALHINPFSRMHAVESGRRHGKGKHFSVLPDEPCLMIAAPFVTVTGSWKNSFSLRLTLIFNLSNGAGLGTSHHIDMDQANVN
jgi:hypothetical protein